LSLLEVARVGKSFGGVRALHDVSFALAQGELVGVMGPNGSGKTTLFNVITGALVPDTGRVVLDGRSIGGLPAHRVCAHGIARTFQLVRPFAGLSALDNVRVGILYGRERRDVRVDDEAWRLLALVGLSSRGGVPAASLTLVDRKRLELARALGTRPRVLLLDEFMAGLNPTETETAMGLIRRLRDEGVTLLMVEHIVWALMDLADRLVVLSAGEKIAEGPPRAVAADPTVIDVYLGTGPR
jgi:ABC-type branched-subunit amino acid transport system ATPase component